MNYTGMTVNERLAVSGLYQNFEIAIKRCDFKLAIEILVQTDLSEEQAQQTISAIKENPNKYGL